MAKKTQVFLKFFGSIAVLNRWTNKPHHHERERARRGWFRSKKGKGPFTLGGK